MTAVFLWLCLFSLSGVSSPLIFSSILGTYPPGEFIFLGPIFLPVHNVHWVFPGFSLVVQTVKNLLEMQEAWAQYLGQKDPLEEERTNVFSLHSLVRII